MKEKGVIDKWDVKFASSSFINLFQNTSRNKNLFQNNTKRWNTINAVPLFLFSNFKKMPDYFINKQSKGFSTIPEGIFEG
jgi:hypothetical protein